MDALVRQGENMIISKSKFFLLTLVTFLTGMCFGGALALEFIPWR